MWGITPVNPGYSEVRIKPQLSKISSSKIKAPTIKGAIHAEYKNLSDKQEEYSIMLPAGMSGEFVLLQKNRSAVYLNDGSIKPGVDVINLKSGRNIIKLMK